MTGVPAILPALLAVKRELGAIPKDGVGPSSQGSYPFVQYDKIIEKLGELFQKHEIIVVPRIINHETTVREAEEAFTTGGVKDGVLIPREPIRNGKLPQVNVREWVEMEYRFISAVDGSEITGSISGEAMDSQDKASRKAHTSAYKSYLIIAFDIVTGEKDPDAINPDDSNRAVTTDQQQTSGQRAIAAARPGAPGRAPSATRPSVTTAARPSHVSPAAAEAAAETGADVDSGEVPDDPTAPLEAPEGDRLDKAKARVLAANTILGLKPFEVNEIAEKETGKKTRAEWIILPTAVEKLAKELERRVEEKAKEAGA